MVQLYLCLVRTAILLFSTVSTVGSIVVDKNFLAYDFLPSGSLFCDLHHSLNENFGYYST